MPYNATDENDIDERNEPSVARRNNKQLLGITLLTCLGIGTVGFLAYQELTKSNTGSAKPLNEETMIIAPRRNTKPYIASDAPTTQPTNPNAPTQAMAAPNPQQIQQSQIEIMMQQEAFRLMQETQKEALKRITSNQVTYDSPASASDAQNIASLNPSITNMSKNPLLGSNKDNKDALPQANHQAPTKVPAIQLTELHGLITQGTIISGIMETAISSGLPGMTRAIVSEDVYSFDKANLLIPTGSSLVGQYRSAVTQGQNRVFIVWDRLIRPDGISINLASSGIDSLGRSGTQGEVDTHFWDRFGSSVLLSIVDAGAQVAVQSANDSNTNIALNTGNGLSRSAEIALENSINIPPTIHIDQGERIKVIVGHDLDFSTVENIAWHE
jgi:type IV secretion system protein VirB10